MSTDKVEAVERALAVLDAFRADRAAMTLSEIASATGLYKSTNGGASWTQTFADNSNLVGVQAVTVGKDAQAEVNVELEHHGRLHRGRGVSTDSLESSAKAFLNAINRVAGHQDAATQPAEATP